MFSAWVRNPIISFQLRQIKRRHFLSLPIILNEQFKWCQSCLRVSQNKWKPHYISWKVGFTVVSINLPVTPIWLRTDYDLRNYVMDIYGWITAAWCCFSRLSIMQPSYFRCIVYRSVNRQTEYGLGKTSCVKNKLYQWCRRYNVLAALVATMHRNGTATEKYNPIVFQRTRKQVVEQVSSCAKGFKFASSDSTRLCSDHFVVRNGPSPEHPLPSIFPIKTFQTLWVKKSLEYLLLYSLPHQHDVTCQQIQRSEMFLPSNSIGHAIKGTSLLYEAHFFIYIF